MNWPKTEGIERNRDIQKKTKRDNFYSQPGDVCKMDAYLDPSLSKIFRNKTGVSPTIQGIMRVKASSRELFNLTKGEMFLKSFPLRMGYTRMGHKNPALTMEIYILRYLSYFSVFKISPCIQQYYMDFTCDTGSDPITQQMQIEYDSLRPYFRDHEEFDNPKARMRYVMTELIKGKSIKDSIADLTEKDFMQIAFQLCYTTNEMFLAGVRHNDLHSSNVMLVQMKPTDMHFVTPQGIVVLEGCKYLAKIIDYDQSSFYEQLEWVLENKKYTQNNGMCAEFGSCATGPNPKKDQVTILSWMLQHCLNIPAKVAFAVRLASKLSSDPQDMLLEPVSKYKSAWPGHLCYNSGFVKGLNPGADVNKYKCKNWIPSDDLFLPFSEMVNRNIFDLKVIPLSRENRAKLPEKTTWTSLSVSTDVKDELVGIRRVIAKELPPVVVPEAAPVVSPIAPPAARPPREIPQVLPPIVPVKISTPKAARPPLAPIRAANQRINIMPRRVNAFDGRMDEYAKPPTPKKPKTPTPKKSTKKSVKAKSPDISSIDSDPMDWEPVVYEPEPAPRRLDPKAPRSRMSDPMDWDYI